MSSYTEGQVHQLANALEKAGFKADDVTRLGQFPDLEKLKEVVRYDLELWDPARRWRVENGIAYFFVVSNGKTGQQWIDHLERKGTAVKNTARTILLSQQFKPTKGMTTEIAVVPGDIKYDPQRIGAGREIFEPNLEVACLIADMFNRHDIATMFPQSLKMSLCWIITQHAPFQDRPGGNHIFLTVGSLCDDPPVLSVAYSSSTSSRERFSPHYGRAYALS